MNKVFWVLMMICFLDSTFYVHLHDEATPYASLYILEKCDRFLNPTSKQASVTFFFPDSIKSRAASRRRLIIHFLRGQVADLGKVPFESGQAAPRVACDFVHGEVEHVVFVQVIEDVYLPRFHEIEQGRIKVPVGVEQYVYPPRSFSVSACLRRVSFRLRNKE